MDKNSSKSSSSKTDRKTIEKNRRNQMKTLYSQLHSVVPHDASSSQEPLSLPEQIDEATNYIQKLQENVENLKRKRDDLVGVDINNGINYNNPTRRGVQIEVHEKGSALEVILVTGLECQFVFSEAIRILHEEHVDVLNASYSIVEGTVFHTIHAQIGEAAKSHGVARITERLKKFAL